jgi:hypothetical protein
MLHSGTLHKSIETFPKRFHHPQYCPWRERYQKPFRIFGKSSTNVGPRIPLTAHRHDSCRNSWRRTSPGFWSLWRMISFLLQGYLLKDKESITTHTRGYASLLTEAARSQAVPSSFKQMLQTTRFGPKPKDSPYP